MAEITKITTPMLPKENVGNRFKPVSDQAFELNDLSKVHKPPADGSIEDRQSGGPTKSLANSLVAPLFRSTNDLVHNFQRMVMLLQMGISTSDLMNDPKVKELLQQLFISPDQIMQSITQQDKSSVLFKGQAFDILRDIMAKFSDSPKVEQSLVTLLKTFEQNVNGQNSIKTILFNCQNILDYMFSKDKEQFSSYITSLKEMLLPQSANPEQEQVITAPIQDKTPSAQAKTAQQNPAAMTQPAVSQEEAAQILKGNLLPLLGEIVVKYHQNEKIRDIVMVVVHNIVRVDKGTDENLKQSISKLVFELRKVANMSGDFEANLTNAVMKSAGDVKNYRDDIMEKLADIIGHSLRSDSNPAVLRQSENLLLSLLQNQSAMMGVQHFILPIAMQDEQVFAELYVDPDSEEKQGKQGENSCKLFLSVESENHGAFELSFLQLGNKVEFSMWCPQVLVESLAHAKKTISNIMQIHGYTMSSFAVQELVTPQSIAGVFPNLLKRKVGIDVRI